MCGRITIMQQQSVEPLIYTVMSTQQQSVEPSIYPVMSTQLQVLAAPPNHTSSINYDIIEGEECSMCGDVGFPEELFRCRSCRTRIQHRYCSRWYLKVLPQARNWACEWCLSAAAADSKSRKLSTMSVPAASDHSCKPTMSAAAAAEAADSCKFREPTMSSSLIIKPCNAAPKLRFNPAADDHSKLSKNCNKRSGALKQIHQAGSSGPALPIKRRRKNNSQSIAGEPWRSSDARRFRSLQDVLCSSC